MFAKKVSMTLIATAAVLSLLTGLQSKVGAQHQLEAQYQGGQTPAGAWITTGTCLNPPGIPPIQGYTTFTQDGSVLATDDWLADGVGHGSWVRTGHRQFALTVQGFFYENGIAKYRGKNRATLTLDPSSGELSGPYVFESFDLATGAPAGGSTGTVRFTRIPVEPMP